MAKVKTLEVDKDKNTELVNRVDIKDSPFQVVTTENGSFGVLGKYRLTEVYPTKKEAETVTKAITWNRIIQVISLVNLILKEEQK